MLDNTVRKHNNNITACSGHVASVNPLLLVGPELRELIAQFLLLSKGVLRVGGDELQRLGLALIGNLEVLSELSKLSEDDKIFTDDRIDLQELLTDAGVLIYKAGGYHKPVLHFDISGGPGDTLYGNKRLMGLALKALLQRVAMGCHRSLLVTAKIRNTGQQISLTVSGGHPDHSSTHHPEYDQPKLDAKASDAPPLLHDLDLLFCQRIIELHGGHIKLMPPVEFPDTGEPLEYFTLTLPTGLPDADRHRLACVHCPITEQANQLAQDIALLLEQRGHGAKGMK